MKNVVVIEGEDSSPEAVRPVVALIDSLELGIEWLYPPVGDAAFADSGSRFPDATRQVIDDSDATLFGATSGPSWDALFYLRWGRETYANVRPTKWTPGYTSPLARPEGIDFIIVRENLEDAYVGVEGDVEALGPLDLVSRTSGRPISEMSPGRYSIKIITEAGTERIARFSFELARKRKEAGQQGKVTCAVKHNMLPVSDGLFLEVTQRVAKEYEDIAFESFIVDDFARRLVADPHSLDVVVLPNLYGDILSDLAAGLIGGLGLAPSGCYGDDYAYFESAHGSAPDIMGRNIINPTATLQSAIMMLEYLGFSGEAERLTNAIDAVYAEGRSLTPDQGGSASTTDFCEAVRRSL
jgi:isocitrate/isopropylmalate dehydrogenase